MGRSFKGFGGANRQVVGVAWYRPEQWQRLLEISEDRDDLETTHEEWEKGAVKTLKNLMRTGMKPLKVQVEVEELLRWVQSRNLPVNGESRSAFVVEILRKPCQN